MEPSLVDRPPSALRRTGSTLTGLLVRRSPRRDVRHHDDHTGFLLSFLPDSGRAEDQDASGAPCSAGPAAIAVPTGRDFATTEPYLVDIVRTAAVLGVPTLLLCSGAARAHEVPASVLAAGDVQVVDAAHRAWDAPGLLPEWCAATSPLVSTGRDTARKRNIALLVARALEWADLLFLDDDVAVAPAPRPDAAITAATIAATSRRLAAHPTARIAGWPSVDFPDNSVVCHARRLVGAPQKCFPGGGSLVVRVDDDVPPFAEIYNEDWLNVYETMRLVGRVHGVLALAGTARQRTYHPFEAARAAWEEPGDLLAEALLSRLHAGGDAALRDDVELMTPAFWTRAIAAREVMIEDIAGRVGGRLPMERLYLDARSAHADQRSGRFDEAQLRVDVIRCLDAARQALRQEQAGEPLDVLLAEFVSAWREDVLTWAKTMRDLVPADVGRALAESSAGPLTGTPSSVPG